MIPLNYVTLDTQLVLKQVESPSNEQSSSHDTEILDAPNQYITVDNLKEDARNPNNPVSHTFNSSPQQNHLDLPEVPDSPTNSQFEMYGFLGSTEIGLMTREEHRESKRKLKD